MDDNATGGLGLNWLPQAQTLINHFSSAGLVVLAHSCYSIESLFSSPNAPPHYELLPHVTSGFPSLLAAIPPDGISGLIRLRNGNRAVTLPASWLRVQALLTCPSHPEALTFLHTAPCKCKCKTFLLPNHVLSPQDLTFLDSTPFGCKIVAPNATMLGLFLHSPFTHVLPSPDTPYHSPTPVHRFDRTLVEAQQIAKALGRMEKRVTMGLRLGLSFRERTIFLTFYVLSLPMYHHSVLLPSPPVLTKYYSLIRRLLTPRSWIQAKHLPGIVSYLKLGILHCPSIHLYSSFLGYCLRCYGEGIAAWLCALVPDLPPLPAQLSSGLLALQTSLVAADPYNSEPFSEGFQRHLYSGLSGSTLSHKLTSLLKRHLTRQLYFHTRTFLLHRLTQVPWLTYSSPTSYGYPPPHRYQSGPLLLSAGHPSLALGYRTRCSLPPPAISHSPHPLPLRLRYLHFLLPRGPLSWSCCPLSLVPSL